MTLEALRTTWPPSRAGRTRAVNEDGCAADPAGPVAQWTYETAAIGFVTSGWFEYASEDQTTLAAPGSVILGNAGEPFSVRHVDTRGNRRLVVSFENDVLEEVANEAGVSARFEHIAVDDLPDKVRSFRSDRVVVSADDASERQCSTPLARGIITSRTINAYWPDNAS